MCFFMDPAINPQLGFVQFPQIFEGMDGDNTFVATLEVLKSSSLAYQQYRTFTLFIKLLHKRLSKYRPTHTYKSMKRIRL